MNLQPAKKHESVTILLVPLYGYSAFPRAVDCILRETRLPFELIIVEANSPDSIRHELEKRKRHRKNIKIIYSNHTPRLAQTLNLGLAHIRTPKVFFMHNNIRVTPHWLENLLQHAKDKHGVVCPYVVPVPGEPHKDPSELDMHGFLITKETLCLLGEFDEKIASPLLGIDMGQWLKKHQITIHRDLYTVLEHAVLPNCKSFDLKLFQRQLNEKQLRESMIYLSKKWGLRLHESKYVDWLQKKKLLQKKTPPQSVIPWQQLPMHLNFPKLSLKKFLQVLTKT